VHPPKLLDSPAIGFLDVTAVDFFNLALSLAGFFDPLLIRLFRRGRIGGQSSRNQRHHQPGSDDPHS